MVIVILKFQCLVNLVMTLQTKPFFSSVRQTWVTPKDLYAALNKEFKFDFDPCPIDAKFDGLNHKWKTSNFINPPHKTQKLWIEKAYDVSQCLNEDYLLSDNKDKFMAKSFGWLYKICVMLLPSRTDTRIFHDMILPNATEIRFLKGRLHYDEHKNSALFPSMIVVFNKNLDFKGKIIGYDYR